MTKDRLSEIIGSGAAAFAAMTPAARLDLVQEMGGRRAAQAVAFERLPEGLRLALVKSSGAVPADCGDAIPQAPARGAVLVFETFASYPAGKAETVVKLAGHMGRKTMMRADVFDTMRAQAARAGGAVALTSAQIGMARIYRGLVEDRAAGAVRCSSVEAMPGGSGGTAEGFTDHRLALSQRIDRLQAAVGSGVAMQIRRVAPSKRGPASAPRRNIPDRDLVEMVCIHDLSISKVLHVFGWSVKGDTVRAATRALGSALDRMIGPVNRPDIVVMRADHGPGAIF